MDDGMNRRQRIIALGIIGGLGVLLLLFVWQVSGPREPQGVPGYYEAPPQADTTPLQGIVTAKWADCFKGCNYWFTVQDANGTSARFSPQQPLYDQVQLGAKVKLTFISGPVGLPVLSGIETLEPPPAPPPPAPEAPTTAPPPPASAPAHKHRHSSAN